MRNCTLRKERRTNCDMFWVWNFITDFLHAESLRDARNSNSEIHKFVAGKVT